MIICPTTTSSLPQTNPNIDLDNDSSSATATDPLIHSMVYSCACQQECDHLACSGVACHAPQCFFLATAITLIVAASEQSGVLFVHLRSTFCIALHYKLCVVRMNCIHHQKHVLVLFSVVRWIDRLKTQHFVRSRSKGLTG